MNEIIHYINSGKLKKETQKLLIVNIKNRCGIKSISRNVISLQEQIFRILISTSLKFPDKWLTIVQEELIKITSCDERKIRRLFKKIQKKYQKAKLYTFEDYLTKHLSLVGSNYLDEIIIEADVFIAYVDKDNNYVELWDIRNINDDQSYLDSELIDKYCKIVKGKKHVRHEETLIKLLEYIHLNDPKDGIIPENEVLNIFDNKNANLQTFKRSLDTNFDHTLLLEGSLYEDPFKMKISKKCIFGY